MTRLLSHVAASLFLLSVAVVTTGDAKAGPLDDAKASGLIGEQVDGYVGAVGDQKSVQALIDTTNAKRKAKYAEIAAKRGAPVDAVAKIAGKKLIERSAAGHYVRDANGQWVKK